MKWYLEYIHYIQKFSLSITWLQWQAIPHNLAGRAVGGHIWHWQIVIVIVIVIGGHIDILLLEDTLEERMPPLLDWYIDQIIDSPKRLLLQSSKMVYHSNAGFSNCERDRDEIDGQRRLAVSLLLES